MDKPSPAPIRLAYRCAILVSGLLVALSAQPRAVAQPVAGAPDPIASYTIEATLDSETHQIRGRQTILWRNTSAVETDELHLHLYLNAFKNSASSWSRHARPEDLAVLAKEGWGWIELSRFAVEGDDLLSALTYLAPDDANGADRTVARVALPRPIPPGGSREITVDFIAQLPRVVARTGFKNDFHLVAQWFPKLGVLAEDGRWQCHQFHSESEFFADFGTYDVSITLPRRFVVGATGNLADQRDNGDGSKTLRFVQQSVHDFAWTAWPRFVEVRHRFRHPKLPEVELTLLLRPETHHFASRYIAALEHSLRLYGRWYGPYPYRTLTVVDPPWGAEQAGGMEYPTLFTTGTELHSPPATVEPEGLIVHEFGHQYWYGLLASNEFEEPYLDEGITTYVTGRLLREAYSDPAWSYDFWGFKRVWPRIRRREVVDTSVRFFRRPSVDPISRTAWGYLDQRAYGSLAYSKMALLMEQIERTVTPPVMQRAMRAYSERFRFHHPRTADLEKTLTAESGTDLGPLFRQLLHGSGRLDYAVTSAKSWPDTGKFGIFGQGGERTRRESPQGRSPERPRFASEVVVRRLGEVRLPVTTEFSFADGRREQRVWDGQERWVRYRIRGPRLLSAEVDPQGVMVLDADRLNNSRRTASDRRASRRWHQRVRFWIQNLLETTAALG